MTLLKANFIILRAILNNILYTNVPNSVQQMVVCFDNQSELRKMNFLVVNDIELETFSITIDEAKSYTLKLIFDDGTEAEMENWQTVATPLPLLEIDLSDMRMSEPEYFKFYVLSCITLSSLFIN